MHQFSRVCCWIVGRASQLASLCTRPRRSCQRRGTGTWREPVPLLPAPSHTSFHCGPKVITVPFLGTKAWPAVNNLARGARPGKASALHGNCDSTGSFPEGARDARQVSGTDDSARRWKHRRGVRTSRKRMHAGAPHTHTHEVCIPHSCGPPTSLPTAQRTPNRSTPPPPPNTHTYTPHTRNLKSKLRPSESAPCRRGLFLTRAAIRLKAASGSLGEEELDAALELHGVTLL